MNSELDIDFRYLSRAEVVLWRLACSSDSYFLWLELASCFECQLSFCVSGGPSPRYVARAWFAGFCNVRASLASADPAFSLWRRLLFSGGSGGDL